MTTKEEIAYWEQVLCDDGLAEISLFDNTGKNKNVTFISTTVDKSGCEHEYSESWEELVNAERYCGQLSLQETDESLYYQLLSRDVASLPAGWPVSDRALLEEYSETGIFEAAMRKVGMTKNAAYAAKRRFEAWRKNTTGC